MAIRRLNYEGMKFGRLTVICRDGKNRQGNYYWKCLCDCGSIVRKIIGTGKKNAHSCGCLLKENLVKRCKTHGDTKSKEYRAWRDARRRCTNPKDRQWKDWGGRGIKVCNEWLNSYETFLADMGRCPSPDYTLDRIDTNEDYSLTNCRWASRYTQARNKRNNHTISFNGETRVATDWAAILGVSYGSFYHWKRKGTVLANMEKYYAKRGLQPL